MLKQTVDTEALPSFLGGELEGEYVTGPEVLTTDFFKAARKCGSSHPVFFRRLNVAAAQRTLRSRRLPRDAVPVANSGGAGDQRPLD